MARWLRRVRGAVGMGLTWAVGWALGGLVIGVASILLPALPWDYFFEIFDAPLPALAVPGFVGGAVFSAVVGIAGRHRRFDELSVPRFAAWGAVGGFLLALIPSVVAATLGTGYDPPVTALHVTAVATGTFALFGAASASASLMLARISEGRSRIEPGEEPDTPLGAEPDMTKLP